MSVPTEKGSSGEFVTHLLLRGGKCIRCAPHAWLALAVGICVTLGAHMSLFRAGRLLHGDEAYVTAFALRMLDGAMLPYVDAVSHRGPFFYWVTAMAVGLGAPFSWMPVRVLAFSATALSILLAFAASFRAGYALAGGLACLAIPAVCIVAMPLGFGMAFHSEHMLNVCVLSALLCLTHALDGRGAHPSRLLTAVAGVCVTLGILSKQIGVVMVVPFGCWVLATALGRPGLKGRARWLLMAYFAGGLIAPLVLLLCRYAAARELGALYYFAIEYNWRVYLAPLATRQTSTLYSTPLLQSFALVGTLLAATLWALTRPIATARGLSDFARACDNQGFVLTVGLSALLTLLFANITLRDFANYYLIVVPWCALLVGLLVDTAARPDTTRGALQPHRMRQHLIESAILLPAALFLYFGWRHSEPLPDVKPSDWIGVKSKAICEVIQEHSVSGDRLFIWGFASELYIFCERAPATRYVYTTFVAGVVPWFAESREVEEQRVVPDSRRILLFELEALRPAVILDYPETLMDRSMRDYEALKAYLDTHYCPVARGDGFTVHAIRGPTTACR